MTRAPLNDRLGAVDALRFVAAALVMFGHTRVPWDTLPWWTRPGRWVALSGGTGVSLFLVLSGFSITLRWAHRESRSGAFPVKAFWLRRFFRLYPTFWLSVPLCFALLLLARGPAAVIDVPRPWLFGQGNVPLVVQVVGYATVITANIVPLAHFGRAWSLALEEQIYALYTLVQARWHALDPMRLLGWSALAVVAYRVALLLAVPGFGSLSTGPIDKREVYASFQLPELAFPWVAGWCIAQARAGEATLPRAARSPITAGALLLSGVLLRPWGGPVVELPGGRECAPVDLLLPLLFAAGFAVLLASVVLGEAPRPGLLPRRWVRAASWAGLWSYSLYLLHPPVLELVDRRSHLPLVPRVVLSWALALLLSWGFWLAVERRWVQRARRVPVTEAKAVPERSPADASGR